MNDQEQQGYEAEIAYLRAKLERQAPVIQAAVEYRDAHRGVLADSYTGNAVIAAVNGAKL